MMLSDCVLPNMHRNSSLAFLVSLQYIIFVRFQLLYVSVRLLVGVEESCDKNSTFRGTWGDLSEWMVEGILVFPWLYSGVGVFRPDWHYTPESQLVFKRRHTFLVPTLGHIFENGERSLGLPFGGVDGSLWRPKCRLDICSNSQLHQEPPEQTFERNPEHF